jgi:GNAT superfamily N-acetyltransferase
MADFTNCPDVRLATPEDLNELMRLTQMACEEDAQHSYNPQKVYEKLLLHFNKQGGVVAVIGAKGQELKGYLLMVVDQIWYSDEWQLLELSLFVAPDHRRSTYAKQLMAFSKQASDGLQLDLTIGVLSSSRTEAKMRLYDRQFKRLGAYYGHSPAAAAE